MDNPNNVTIDNATYNSLIGSDNNISSSILSQIISHLSGSLIEGAKLNTDYTDYSNFIHFGSAEERLVTFRHKLEQIKEYESKSAE
ncbi:MAG: hypothetical protein H8E13_16935 [Actinobacteria bacterium]|nr:hypothetical protein [Actinomycetota bacterium]